MTVATDLSFDYVRLDGFTPTTWDFLRGLIEDVFGEHVKRSQPTLIAVEVAAALFVLLRRYPDERFPGGKWATIHHLEGLIEATVDAALRRSGVVA